MEIKTKFDINDLVFYFLFFINEENKVDIAIVSSRISMILVKEEGIRYWLEIDNREVKEDELFATREEAEKKLKELQNDNQTTN